MSGKPYYDAGGVTLHLGDAEEVAPTLPMVDLLLADPPYGAEYRSHFRAEQFALIAHDRPTDRPEIMRGLAAAVERLREHRHVYVFGRLSEPEAEALRLASTAELIWDKGILGMGDLSLPWGPSHEPITFAVYRPSAQGRVDGRGRLSARLRQGSVLREQRANALQVSGHPTPKPVGILRQMIESSSVLGETVLDPFAGGGSTLVAAVLEGRRCIGIEIEERYCEEIARRMECLQRQGSFVMAATGTDSGAGSRGADEGKG